MTTIYIKSPDEKTIGVIRYKAGAEETLRSLRDLGVSDWQVIHSSEYRQLKAQILRRMTQPKPSNA